MATITTSKTDELSVEEFRNHVRRALHKNSVEIQLNILEEKVTHGLKAIGIKAESSEIREAMCKVLENGTLGVLETYNYSSAGGYRKNEKIETFSAAVILKS